MIYKFRSKAAADLVMLQAHGDALLRILGREPSDRGIIEPPDLPAAMQAIRDAIEADEGARAQAEQEASARGERLPPRHGVTLRQRLWPIAEMMRRALAAGEPIVWGV